MKRSESIVRGYAPITAWTAALLFGACLTTSPALAAEGSCSNEARRAEQSSIYLPNCRAYEQVTPVAKGSGEPRAVQGGLSEREPFVPIEGAHAAIDGERMAWISEYSLPDLAGSSTPGLDYLSTRGPEGWSTVATIPPQSPENGLLCPEFDGILGWSSNLAQGVLADGDAQENEVVGESFRNQGFGCGHAEPALGEADGVEIDEPQGFQNLFLRDSETATYQLVNVTPSTAPRPTPRENAREVFKGRQPYFPPEFLAGSADLNEVVFEDELPLTVEAEHLTKEGKPLSELEAACKEEPKGRACWEGHDDVYVWSEGQQPTVRLVTVLPDGDPVEGALAGSTRSNAGATGTSEEDFNVADDRHAVSANGSRVFFEAEGGLYVRENGGQPQSALGPRGGCTEPAKACTIQLDLPQGGKGTTGGGGKWLGANAEGTTVFFTDEASKGLTSTTIEGSGADLYEYELPSEADTPGALIDLTPDANAEVTGMSGVSEDGSYVYFVAAGKLNGEYVVGGRGPAQPEPKEGEDNLYVSHQGTITFIATLSAQDLCDWTSNTGCNLVQPTNPRESGLTARVSGNGRYLAFNSVNELTGYDNVGPACVPLSENGTLISDEYVPGSCEEIFLYEADGSHLACVSCNPDPNIAPSAQGAAIDWPAGPDHASAPKIGYPQRNVSESGQVFFETSEELLPQQDTNGLRDVYEYEHGTLSLISSGTSSAPSYFLDAAPSGSDVFFATAQKLLPRDADASYDIYDARVGGGFPEPPSPPLPCESEECRGSAVATAVFSPPSSTAFVGSGNVVQVKSSTKPKPQKTAKQKRNAKRRRELQACARRYRHNRHERAQCERRARRSLSQKKRAKASRRGRRGVGR